MYLLRARAAPRARKRLTGYILTLFGGEDNIIYFKSVLRWEPANATGFPSGPVSCASTIKYVRTPKAPEYCLPSSRQPGGFPAAFFFLRAY